jgi:hypothetical protein
MAVAQRPAAVEAAGVLVEDRYRGAGVSRRLGTVGDVAAAPSGR